MHYSNLVIIEKPEDGEPLDEAFVRGAVEQAMGPSEDNGGFWDWYQIGGRWTGALDGYDPETDPANQKPCEWCEATGITTAAVGARYPAYLSNVGKTCFQCKGTGKATEWPTAWPFRLGDVRPVESLQPEQYERFHRVVSPSAGVFESERYEPWRVNGERFVKLELPPLDWLKQEYPNHLAVIVDNHS